MPVMQTIPPNFENVTRIIQVLAQKPYNLTPYKNLATFYSELYDLNLIKWLVNKNICTPEELYSHLIGRGESKRILEYLAHEMK